MTLGDAEFNEALVQGWIALLEGQIPNLTPMAHAFAREVLLQVEALPSVEASALDQCADLCADLLLTVYRVALAQVEATAREAVVTAFGEISST